jgi:hypothetical protein
MGCDIHLHIERRHRESVKKGFDTWWQGDIYGEFSDRNYKMFAYLADVRSDGDDERIVPERGIPDDVSDSTKDYYLHPILENEKTFEWYYDHPCIPVTQETADDWVKRCGCKILENGRYKDVTDPDFHSYNWCTADELEKCIKKAEDSDWGVGAAWKALLAYMRAYEDGNYEVRAVYWFDN